MNASSALVAKREIDVIEMPIFADLLTRISRYLPLTRHAYGGMSGFAMDDQKKLYRTLGARPMLSFDERQEIVARQRFNRPTIRSRVRMSTFETFAAEWPRIFEEEGIEDADNYILWVRRDTSDHIGQGVRYFQQMVGLLGLGGIARISLRIDYERWAGPTHANGRRRLAADRRRDVAGLARDHLGEFLEIGDVPDELDDQALYRVLANAYGTAGADAIGTTTGHTFEPLSVVSYGKGPVELTLTGMVVATADRQRLRDHVEEGDWPFASGTWDDVKEVKLPDVTFRERLELEATAGDRLAARSRLHFDLDEATNEAGVFDSFARYHRYIPAMVAAEF